MDITIHVIIKPADHTLEGISKARRYLAGDIVEIYRAERYATLQADGMYLLNKIPIHPMFGFIHVKNVPNSIDRKKIKTALLSGLYILDELIRRRKWHIPPAILPSAFKQKLIAEKQATVEFSVVKNYIRKKTVPVILDASQDDITTPLTDEDLE